ncbi:MAG: polyketide synthase, partial [Polyangiaceae bacterium]|nr:polyketide synthase [Polyangiaceae bacterium]
MASSQQGEPAAAPASMEKAPPSLSTEERALRAIEKLKRELSQLKAGEREPIAIVGTACRLPGDTNSLDDLWALLDSEKDTLSEIPSDRFPLGTRFSTNPDEDGKTYVKHASLLSNITAFDPTVFGITPIEAEALDPQQRLLLECVFEALADAGVADLRGNFGVFIGVSAIEFALRSRGAESSVTHLPYLWTGTSQYGVANRISYSFDLKGPSIAADGACASSLVALHLACQNLRERRIDVAVSGAANVLLSAEEMVIASKMHALSPDGRCKSFDASGDGYGRGEGAGIVILKRLSDAVESGERILGLIRGTATNHGGHASGFTVPSAAAQGRLIKEALARGSTSPYDVSYVESHGTGTVLGDPIEIEGIRIALVPTHREQVRVGSIKTNIGHLEAAAGIAGVLKVLAALQHRELPASRHFHVPNPQIPWDSIPIKVQTELTPWPEPSKPLIAGVSSFGIGGTNAHVIISEAPAEPEEKWAAADVEASRKDLVLPLAISAKV